MDKTCEDCEGDGYTIDGPCDECGGCGVIWDNSIDPQDDSTDWSSPYDN